MEGTYGATPTVLRLAVDASPPVTRQWQKQVFHRHAYPGPAFVQLPGGALRHSNGRSRLGRVAGPDVRGWGVGRHGRSESCFVALGFQIVFSCLHPRRRRTYFHTAFNQHNSTSCCLQLVENLKRWSTKPTLLQRAEGNISQVHAAQNIKSIS